MTTHTKGFIIAATSTLIAASFVLPAFAATTTPMLGGATTPAPKTMDLSCVQTAVDAREGALGDAFSTFSSAESAALAARKTALHDAWGMTNAKERRTARNKAWSTFRTANHTAYAALRTARKSAWATFATASKACKTPVVEAASEEGAGSLGL